MEKRPILAMSLAILGVVWIGALWLAMAFAKGMSGMGDGASSGRYMSIPLIVVPYLAFFSSGTVAAVATERRHRLICFVLAHSVPAASLLGAMRDRVFLAAIVGITFVVFSPFWFLLLRQRSTDEENANK